ncbi:MAG: SDR family NAD(P)-dependent oxidoreductase [Gammaproteobacteria bacterium]|nr:SDR family NAD(P)-dependent oxidoreductase [Gammaproteobacteria bacterium]
MKILVTGGSGFIASHVVDRLLRDGHDVTALDLWRSAAVGRQTGNPRMKFVQGDILQDKRVSELMRGQDVLIHAASILGTSETITAIDVEQTALTNVVGGVKMLKHANAAGVRRVIVPTTPDVAWLNPYKITKSAVQKFCQLYHRNFGLETLALQLGNVYGPRERYLESEDGAPFNYEKIIPTVLMRAMRGETFFIYGDGEQRSEYVYIDDVVESFARAVAAEQNLGGTVIPVGCGRNLSVNQVVETVRRVWGRDIKTAHAPMRPGEAPLEIALDPGLLSKHLGYRLRYSLEQGLAQTIPYYESMHLHGARGD